MANSNAPHGFMPKSTLHGGPWRCQEFAKAGALANAIFIGDVVHRTGPTVAKGNLEPFNTGTPGTTLISGVALNYAVASLLSKHQVVIDPQCVFEAQDNNSTDGVALADLGKNANVSTATAGNAANQLSGHQISEASIAVTGTLDMHLIDLLNVPDNAFGANARILVLFNKHRMAPASVGV